MLQGRLVRRGALLLLVLTLLVVGSLLGSDMAGSRAYAQEPAMLLYGTVDAGNGPLPSRVRASIDGANCGTADVTPQDDSHGFYAIYVVSADTKAGCGVAGASVSVRLLNGAIDSGTLATVVSFAPGQAMQANVSMPTGGSTGQFVGFLPNGPGDALMAWAGPSGTPIEQAIASIPRVVEAVYFWDATRQEYRSYIPDAAGSPQTYTFVDADDVVLVRVQ